MAKDYKEAAKQKQAEAKKIMTPVQWKKCGQVIHTATAASAAGGFIPFPVMDAVPISAAQIAMVLGLGKIFDSPITESVARGIISTAAGTFIGRNLVKMIPFLGWGVSAVVAAGVTEAIGWAVAVDLAKGRRNWADSSEDGPDSPRTSNCADASKTADNDDGAKEAIRDWAERTQDFIQAVGAHKKDVFRADQSEYRGLLNEYTKLSREYGKVEAYLSEDQKDIFKKLNKLGC